MDALLEIKNLRVQFPVKHGLWGHTTTASIINSLSLAVKPGEILGIVGESGCGKSTLVRTIMKINPITSGQIAYQRTPVGQIKNRDYYHHIQMIFQDPFSSLNPKMKIGALLAEMLELHQPQVNVREASALLMDEVGLPATALDRYPHEFSGGQRQRIAIARALAAKPSLLIADEAVSALDVSIQAQILNLLKALQERYQLSLIFISHDLNIVNAFCDRILVMYLGKFVEHLPGKSLHSAKHPYSKALLNSLPNWQKKNQHLELLSGEPPSVLDIPPGCPFYSRCNESMESCTAEFPSRTELGAQHWVHCQLYQSSHCN
ncbi:MAG: ABC transporter ATP-binding protein [SAR324 cluster bacterium]|nr:ABC transporter ATP-binding protein [SAR324 cluster bacterium]